MNYRICFAFSHQPMRVVLLTSLLVGLLIAPHNAALAQSYYPDCGYQAHRRPRTYDTVRFLISYRYSTYRDPKFPAQRDEDEVWVEIGDSVTKSYSRPRWVNDSIVQRRLDGGAENYRPLHQWCMREEILIGVPQDSILWTYQDVVHNFAYWWYEQTPRQIWTLEEGQKTVIGYACRKATLDFRGRHYTAWYAPDIPLPHGPWSFHGLPGLILEIRDDTDRVSFVANWFAKARGGLPLIRYHERLEEVSRSKARKLIEFMHKHPYIHAGDWAKGARWLRENPKLEWKHTWVELE